MASIGKRGLSYYLDWRHPETGERTRTTLGKISQRDAELALKAKEVELGTGAKILGHLGRAAQGPLFSDFADEYLEWYRLNFPANSDRVESIIKTMKPLCRNLRLEQVTSKIAHEILSIRMQERPKAGGRRAVNGAAKKEKPQTLSAGTVEGTSLRRATRRAAAHSGDGVERAIEKGPDRSGPCRT